MSSQIVCFTQSCLVVFTQSFLVVSLLYLYILIYLRSIVKRVFQTHINHSRHLMTSRTRSGRSTTRLSRRLYPYDFIFPVLVRNASNSIRNPSECQILDRNPSVYVLKSVLLFRKQPVLVCIMSVFFRTPAVWNSYFSERWQFRHLFSKMCTISVPKKRLKLEPVVFGHKQE